jgi:hypothetical protein
MITISVGILRQGHPNLVSENASLAPSVVDFVVRVSGTESK